MNIAIYAEGGIGDVLLAHQKAWILRETKYPEAEFTIFLDTEGNQMQARVLKYLFPNFYKEIFTIPNKKYKKLVINSQFGEEEVKGFTENVPDEWTERIMSYEKRYNFHIDSLQWLVYDDLEWAKYHKIFPVPEIKNIPANFIGDYFISNLYSATGTEHKIENWWSDRIILELDQLAQKLNYRHLIISTPELNEKYSHLIPKLKFTMIINTDVEDVCNLIAHSKGLVGIDSAWRLISHMFDKPTVTISKNCTGFGGVPPSHQIRWLPFPETTFAIHHSANDIVRVFEKILGYQIYKFLPQLSLLDNPYDVLIKRDYKVNEKKSILN
jgi:hypothetical protein